jgi:hypothetical protein
LLTQTIMASRLIAVPSIPVASAYTWFNASTSRFDVASYESQKGSCGGCGLNLLANFEGWAAVSAAESMQVPYACDGDYACATGGGQADAVGVSGGCGQCYSVHTQGTNPWDAELPKVQFYAAVVDTCAHEYNRDWCAKHVGAKNSYGFEYHINVLGDDADKLKIGDNPIVHFRPVECPEQVLEAMQKSCCDQWYKGVGCSSICPDNQCSPPAPSPSPTPSPPAPSPSPTPGGACDPACTTERTCVTQADGYWSQCIDCSAKVFQKECGYWGKALLEAAEETCNAKCSASLIV